MTAVRTIGIVGAGAAGLTLAIYLADAGFNVEVLEKADGPSTLGSGITLQGNALRIFRDLGLWQQLEQKGFAFNELGLRAPDPEATVLAVLPDVRTGGEDLPATLGIPRAELTDIVRRRAVEAGVKIHFGASVTDVFQDTDSVTVRAASGATFTFELLVGADGHNSTVRSLIGVVDRPLRTGMGAWRAFVPRPSEVTRTDLIYGGPAYIAGYCPTGEDTMYAYLVERAQERDAHDGPRIMAELARAYGGPWQEIAESIREDTPINYTQFTAHIVEGPWHRGRVVLTGDAAHNCPPTIAQGAAMAVEDSAVLADELIRADSFDESLLLRYRQRREARIRTVVEASVQLGQWMLDGHKDADVPGLMHRVAHTVAVPV
ncbi:FAD-dependent monooxygenase [Arthrobacter sp.]|uniref:FAD-dependent monooxygenase n=1 Tax=Arthrobacter sp. TaxID=1667 RepID=UPI002896E0D5|nr:FAD-dependent monooxygenase [Arthrobacter sp.]